jgi:hypothetical protein
MIKFNRVVVIRPYFFFHSEGLLSDSKDSNTRFLPNLKLKKKVSTEIPIKSVNYRSRNRPETHALPA